MIELLNIIFQCLFISIFILLPITSNNFKFYNTRLIFKNVFDKYIFNLLLILKIYVVQNSTSKSLYKFAL